MKEFDAKIQEYLEKLIAFSPDAADDTERAAIIAEGAALIEEKTASKPKTMEDIVDDYAAGVDTGSIDIPEYVAHDAARAKASVEEIVKARKATKEAYKKGALTIATTLIKIAALAA